MRDVLFTDAFSSRCRLVPLLLQSPGVVFAELKAERLNKEGGKRHSSEESKSWNVICWEVWDCQPSRYWQVLGPVETPSPFQPLPAAPRDRNEPFSGLWAASESELLPFCQRNQLLKYWTKISNEMVPKQTGFRHWIYILHLNICKLFFWRSLYKCILAGRWSPPSPPCSEPAEVLSSHCFGLIWGLIPSLSYHCFLNSCGNSVLVQNSFSVMWGPISST